MPIWLAVLLLTAAFAALSAWVSRRLLDAQIGWVRALVTSAVVFLGSLPLTAWVFEQADVIDGDRVVVESPIVVAFVALVLGWIFAVVVVILVTLEFLWPSRPLGNPVTIVREAFRRRDRARRYAQIVAIASRHGLGMYRGRSDAARDALPQALVAALAEAGVTFVKLGQVLSTREDVLPRDLIEALSTLQMDSTPIPWPEAEAAIRAELRRPITEVFAEIESEPMAAASVAQVHAATLVSGERVVVKIQRPSARAQVTTDLDILERLARDAERRTAWAADYGAVALVAEFSRALTEELDYRIEVANAEMLRGAIAKTHAMPLRVPRVFPDLCTQRMIVQERIEGVPFGKLPEGVVEPGAARALADGVLDAVFEQIAVRGVFHADLHPGNLILCDDGEVALIDFGAVGILEASMRRLLVPLLTAIAADDDQAATDIVLLLCEPDPAGADQAALQRDVGAIITRVRNAPAGEDVFRLLLDTLRHHRLAMPPSLLLVFRTLGSLEGSLRRVYPGYDMVGQALTRAPHFARSMLSLRAAALSAQTQLVLALEQVRRVPRRLENISRSLEQGTFSVRLRSFEGAGERRWIEGMLGQVTSTLVGVTLLATGIALAISSGGPQLTEDVPLFPFLGSVVGLGGLLLLVRSLRAALRRRDGAG
ncbi:ABC1 kinase family protein [Microbacterium sp. UBA837]|uniref:ABC1 kinase family protein n=1 Tax=Microbacterium sp. UBA837 TaxID=1946956 RepID=UPI0025CB825D|nr:AarF/UbiB family protein [Microbacterium sp. UBA837]